MPKLKQKNTTEPSEDAMSLELWTLNIIYNCAKNCTSLEELIFQLGQTMQALKDKMDK